MADYLLKDGLSPITYSRIAVDENNAMHYESGGVTLRCSNTLYGYGSTANYAGLSETLLHEFFEVHNSADAFLFTVEIRESDRDELLFAGVIRKDGITFDERRNEILNIEALSLDKEFQDYFSGQLLPDFDNIPASSVVAQLTLDGQSYARLTDVIRAMFPGVSFNFSSSHFAYRYFMAKRGYMYAPVSSALRGTNTLVIPAGYESFYLDKIDCFTFFNSLLMSMGWRWGFEGTTCKVKKLYDATETITEIDFEDSFISHSMSFEVRHSIRNVIMDGVEFYGTNTERISNAGTAMNTLFFDNYYGIQGLSYYYLGGVNHKIFDGAISPVTNSSQPFRNLLLRNIVGGAVYDRDFSGDTVSIQSDQEIEGKYKRTLIQNITLLSWYANDELGSIVYDDNHTLYLRPYMNSGNNGTHLDISVARRTNNQYYGNGNAYNAAQDAGNNGIYSRGNPGSTLLRLANDLVYEDYNYYTNSQEWRDQMKTLTGSGDRLRMEVLLHGLITGINARYSIDNYPYHDIEGVMFTAEKTELDLINNTTKLSLVSQ